MDTHEGQILSASGRPLPRRWLPLIATIWIGQAVAVMTSYAANYAAVWYITETTDSALWLAVGSICAFLPMGLLAPFAGVVADKYNRKTIMIVAETGVGVTSLVLGLIILGGNAGIPVVLVMLAVRSIGQAFRNPAMTAAMPLMVPEKHLLRINTLDQMLMSMAAIVSPALGIFLYTSVGFYSVMFLDFAGALLAVGGLALAKIPTIHDETAEEQGVWSNLRDGWQALSAKRGLVVLMAGLALGMMIVMPTDSLFPLMTYDHFGGDGYMASLTEAVFGVGILVGSVIILVWGGGRHLARLMCVAAIIVGVTTTWCGLTSPDQFMLFLGLLVVMAVASAWFNGPIMTLLQHYVPEEKLGRAMGLLNAAIGLATPLGIALGGIIAQYTGVALFYAGDGIAILAVGILMYLPKSVRELDAPRKR